MTETIYFVAGETSGDNHGAALMRALRERGPQMRFAGRGGPKMRALAGDDFRDWIDAAAVVGLWEVLKHYRFFREQFRETIAEIATARSAAVVLIDYPGFNLRLGRALRRKFPRLKIIYYISPQIWAWNRRRITQMSRWLDLMLCIFPFEPELYRASGLRAVFIGHPLTSVQKTFEAQDEGVKREANLVALFPGSRQREVQKIFPIVRDAAIELLRTHPYLRFEVAAASESLAQIIRSLLDEKSRQFIIAVEDARGLMQRARVGMVASGTATLEATLLRMPFVLVYRVAWLTYFAARLVVKVKHLGMPNVIAQREIVPEFIQHRARPRQIASAVARLITSKSERNRMLADFDAITAALGHGEAGSNAADAILTELQAG